MPPGGAKTLAEDDAAAARADVAAADHPVPRRRTALPPRCRHAAPP